MIGPAPAPGPDLACREFLTACAALAAAEERARALRPGPSNPPLLHFRSAEALAVLRALRATFRPSDPGAPGGWEEAQEGILRSPAAIRALAHFADAARCAEAPAEAEETERRLLSAFPENTPEKIARALAKKRAQEGKTLAAFRRKHGDGASRFEDMGPEQRREYVWMWAQSAFLAKRRFMRAAAAWVRVI